MLRFIWRLLGLVTILFGANVLVAIADAGEPKQGGAEPEKLPPRAVARLGSTAFAQAEVIYAVALAPGGKMAATAGSGEFVRDDDETGKWNYDRLTIHLWDVPAGQSSRQIPVPEGPVLTLDFSPDGKSLAAGAGKSIFVWDVATGKETVRIPLDHDAFQMRFAPDGKQLLINLFDKKAIRWEIMQWDLEKRAGKVLWNSKKLGDDVYVPSLELSLDGARLGILIAKLPEIEEGKPVVEPPPHRVQVLELPSGKSLFQADGKNLSDCLALSPDKKTVVFGSERLALWDIAGNRKDRELAGIPSRPAPPPGVDPQGAPPAAPKEWRTAALVSYSPNGKFIVSAYWPGYVTLWNAETGVKIGEYLHTFRRPLYHASDVLVFSRDSTMLALGGSQVLRIVDTGTGKEISSWPGHRLPISSFRFSPDGQTLFTYNEAEICAWQAGNWKQQARHNLLPLQKKSMLAWSLEKNLLITWNKGEYLLEDLSSDKVLAKFPVKDRKFDGASFSYEGKTCCLETLTESGTLSAVFFSVPDCKELFQLKQPNVQSSYFSPVRNIYTWTDRDGFRFEADGITGKISKNLGVQSFEPGGPPAFTLTSIFSWDGKYLLTQSVNVKEQAVRIWDLDAGRTTHRLQFPPKRFISGIDFTFDSRLMVYVQAGRNGICVLELASGKERRSLVAVGQPNPGRVVTSPTDFVIAAGLPGNTVLVWDLARPAGKLAKPKLTDKELDGLWLSLADANAIKAEDAIESLVQYPAQAVPFLRDRLKPVTPLDSKHLGRLIADLGSVELEIQDKALVELEKNLELAEPALRQALSKGKTTKEARGRMEELLAKPLAPPDAETLRGLRAIEALEKIGTRDARAVIEPLTLGAPGARITQDASATVKRLDRHW